MTGNCVPSDMEAVKSSPFTRSAKDITMPVRGPARAKSNIDLEFGGGDRSGVMAPVKPVVIDGTNVGSPTSN